MYVITGATGNTGKVIAEKLLEAGKKVRVIGRSKERLQPLLDQGAEAAVGSLDDSDFLSKAFRGATAVYAMIPPNFTAENFRAYQNKLGEAIAEAIEEAGVKNVVHLSSLGAHLPEGTGPILGLYDQEKRLNNIKGVNVLHLRPTYFMENQLANIDLIKKMGINGSPIKADIPIPMIASRDIGDYAARRLLKLDFSGSSVQELVGPKDYTMKEITRTLGKAVGKPDLSYVEFPYEDAHKAMVEMGVSADLARAYNELNRAVNEGHGISPVERDSENTTNTTLEEFAKEFAAIYQH